MASLPRHIPTVPETLLTLMFAAFIAQQELAPHEQPDPSASDLDTSMLFAIFLRLMTGSSILHLSKV